MRRPSIIVLLVGLGLFFSLAIIDAVQAQSTRLLAEAAPGLNAPSTVAAVTITEADALITVVFSELEVMHYETATSAYLWMLAQVDRPVTQEEAPILLRHLRSLAMILETAERTALGLDDASSPSDLSRLPPDFGARLVRWWLQQDPLPATAGNERLEEHLTRVAFASHKYQRDDDVRGFDDRGEIYIRLGKPFRSKTVTVKTAALLVSPVTTKVPDNEFWVYKHIGYDAHYVFIRKSRKQAYELGYATDLIPLALRNGRRKTDLLLQTMEEVFVELALEHGSFGEYHDEVASYLTLPPSNAYPPHLFAQRLIERAFNEDQRHEWARAENIPSSYYNPLGTADALQVPVRWARFLDPDGTTRTELYWGLDARALQPSRRLLRRLQKLGHEPSDKYLVTVSGAQRDQDYHHRQINQKHYLVPTAIEGSLPPRTFVTKGDTARYHLAMQWEQQWTRQNKTNPSAILPGVSLKIGTLRADSLDALDAQGLTLEMSDLKPLLPAGGSLANAMPYPYPTLTPDTPLALYFELYHLTFSKDDQTHYTIEYSISEKKKAGLFQRTPSTQDEGVGAQSAYTGTDRIAREYIMLDLSTWPSKGEIEITLRATDQTTGHQVTRMIPFTLDQ